MRAQTAFAKFLTLGGILSQRGFVFSKCLPLLSTCAGVQSNSNSVILSFCRLPFMLLSSASGNVFKNLKKWRHCRALSAVRAHLVSAVLYFYSSRETISTSHGLSENLTYLLYFVEKHRMNAQSCLLERTL